MPLTFADRARARADRAQERNPPRNEQRGQPRSQLRTGAVDRAVGLGSNKVAARQVCERADKAAFLRRAKSSDAISSNGVGSDAISVRHQNKPLPTPRHNRSERPRWGQAIAAPQVAVEIERTPEELANLAQRRALRDAMVDAYGEEVAGAAFAHVGVALKGEGKFAPLSEATRQALQRYVPDCIGQAREVVLEAMARTWPGGLPSLQRAVEFGISQEIMLRQVQEHPKYGKDVLSKAEAYSIACAVCDALVELRDRLIGEVELERHFQRRMGYTIAGAPASIYQVIADYEAEHPEHIHASEADIVELKKEFAEYNVHSDMNVYYGSLIFIAGRFPSFSDEKLEAVAAQCSGVYACLLAMMPKDLAHLIGSTVWAVFQRELFPVPAVEAKNPAR